MWEKLGVSKRTKAFMSLGIWVILERAPILRHPFHQHLRKGLNMIRELQIGDFGFRGLRDFRGGPFLVVCRVGH